MQKQDQCHCGSTITLPNSECLYECHCCKQKGYFVCHIVTEPTDPMLVRCKICKIAYSIFECPQCQGTAVMKEFKSGQQYGCVCGFNATFVACNMCTALLCLPPRNNYEKIKIGCKKCNHQFKYRVCKDCKECNYFKPTQDAASVTACFNQHCKNSTAAKLLKQPPQSNGLSSKKWNTCRVCNTNEAEMINSECMHLSVCQHCVSTNRNMNYPLCQAVGRRYFKVKIQ